MRCVCSGDDSDAEDENYRSNKRKRRNKVFDTDDDMDLPHGIIEVKIQKQEFCIKIRVLGT